MCILCHACKMIFSILLCIINTIIIRFFMFVPPLYEAGCPRVTHPSAAQSLSSSSEDSENSASLDLHVLGTPPAFILSQDQTLVIRTCSGQDQLSLIYPVTVVWFVELKVPVLNNSLEFSGIVVYCSVIKVLGAVSRQLY